MFNTVLFDLDGTLIDIDKDEFARQYMKSLALYFDDICENQKIYDILTKGTIVMMKNNGEVTNMQAFVSHLKDVVGEDESLYMDRFNEYYRSNFDKLKILAKKKDIMIKSINILKEKGYLLGIATNPMLPIEAMEYRVSWAGLDLSDFEVLTSFEQNKFSKPNKFFYKEIADIMKKRPSEILMVGNDTRDDMVASEIGMNTYFLTDQGKSHDNVSNKIDYSGNSENFYEFVKNLPSIA